MNAGWQRLQPWAAVIVPTLLHFLWQGALVALIAGTVAVICRKSSASTRYAVFLGLFAMMAVTPLVTATMAMQGVPLAPPVSDLESATAVAPLHWQSQWHTEEAIDELNGWQPIVLLVWLGGVALCSLRLTGGLMWYVWLTGRLEPITLNLGAVVTRLSQRLGLNVQVRVALSQDIREPLAIRLIQPLIVLPASWLLNAPPLMVEAVLAHELAHIRRHDLWVNLLQRVVETLLFFHPAVWWLSRQIRRERELCCDMLAVAATGRAIEYAQALEAVARFRLAWPSPAMAAGMGGDRMALLERVRRVLGLETAAETGWWPVSLAGLLLLAAAAGTGVAMTSGVVQGDDEKPVAKVVEEDDDEDDDDKPAPRREGDRPHAEDREDDRRDPPRGEGDRRSPEGRREGDRPREGNRPLTREGDRRPEERPRGEGDRGPRPADDADWARRSEMRRDEFRPRPDVEVMHELLATIRELRQEVQMLRQEMRTLRGPAPHEGSRDDYRRMLDVIEGRGPHPEGQPGRKPDGRPREEAPRDGEPRPRGESPVDARPGREGPPREGRAAAPRESRERGPRPDGDRREDTPRKEPRGEDTPPRRESEDSPSELRKF